MAAYVVIGAGIAGATAAVTLRDHSAQNTIALIGAEPDAPYERPLLSKGYLRGDVAFGATLVLPTAYYAEHGIETHFGVRARRIDTSDSFVELEDDRRMPFDALLIATGARNRRPSIPGSDLDGVMALSTARDAGRIKTAMAAGQLAVVVGMGFIGSEVAASLRQKGIGVVAIDRSRTPLFRVLGPAVGEAMAELHRAHGVQMIFEDAVAAFEGTRHVSTVVTQKGLRIDCDFVVVGAGVEPATEVLSGSGVQLDNGVLVDEYCETNVPGIFAAGDVANHYQRDLGRHIRVEHWHNAFKQGAAAARNMLGMKLPYDELPWFWSDQYDSNLQYAGFHTTWDEVVVRGRLESGSFLACYVKDGRIDAAVALNRPKDLRRIMPFIKTRRVVNLAAIRDECRDLRTLMEDPTALSHDVASERVTAP
jgi:3-phenylpropionate/trans-cinnamate dioxygenase ferredoxin reductase component